MKNKVLIGVITALVLVVAVLGYLNRERLAERQALVDDPGIVIMAGGEEVATIYLAEIRELGEEEFPIVLHSSGKPPHDLVLTGVPLIAVLRAADPALLESGSHVVVRAIDGYTVAYTLEELLWEKHIYLVYMEDGELLGGKADGGSGPLMVVPRQDEFGQRWCKFAVEVDIN